MPHLNYESSFESFIFTKTFYSMKNMFSRVFITKMIFWRLMKFIKIWQNTVWTMQILREINFRESRSSKTAKLTFSEVVNFGFGESNYKSVNPVVPCPSFFPKPLDQSWPNLAGTFTLLVFRFMNILGSLTSLLRLLGPNFCFTQ